MLVISLFAGVGGGNFASSMTNINAYFPARLKGWALGINAGGGNLGVPVVQLVGLLVLATLGVNYPRVLVAIYIPLIILAAIGAALFMDNLTQNSNAKGAIREVTRHRETWIMALLYIGTFGSFIGFGFAFGQVLLVQFPDQFPVPVKAAALTFLGPLLGSLIRPFGGGLADRFKGSVVTFYNFIAMAVGARRRADRLAAELAAGVLDRLRDAVRLQRHRQRLDLQDDPDDLPRQGSARGRGSGWTWSTRIERAIRRAGALIGLAGAIGALGGVMVNLAFRQSFLTLKNGDGAYIAFIAFYAICFVVTWAVFIRKHEGRLEGV